MTSFCLSSITLKLEIHFHSSLLISILCLDNILHLKARPLLAVSLLSGAFYTLAVDIVGGVLDFVATLVHKRTAEHFSVPFLNSTSEFPSVILITVLKQTGFH